MSSIALLGATGNAGSHILKELSDRGHRVTAIARSVSAVPPLPGVTAVAGDAADTETIVPLLRGHDAVISALPFSTIDPTRLLRAVREAGIKRYLVVGGAGSLEAEPGVKLIDHPDFPTEYKFEASHGVAFLDLLRNTADDLEWSFISPSILFGPGGRTGVFRLGGDQVLRHEGGSSISYEDYAIALVNELEHPAHIRQRFTVGY
ncbi:NAD(P)-dependent oxidoreductase [Granulibacter bethesdensis]|nr:NAD(P)-dependent oxidoreductase [Granulibacter bethesdensis]